MTQQRSSLLLSFVLSSVLLLWMTKEFSSEHRIAGVPSSDRKPVATAAQAAPAVYRPPATRVAPAAPVAAAAWPKPPAAVPRAPAPAAVATAPALPPKAAVVTPTSTYTAPTRASPMTDASKMYSDTQVFLVERDGEDPGMFSALNICCNLFMGACIGATAVLLAMFFFTDCRFVLKTKNVTRNRTRAALEEWDGGEARGATELEPATSTVSVVALDDTGEPLTTDGARSSTRSMATPSVRASRKGVRKRPATMLASRRTVAPLAVH